MRVISKVTTEDGRLSKNKMYEGEFWYKGTKSKSGSLWRIKIKEDNYGKTMTFDPEVFTALDNSLVCRPPLLK